MIDSYDFADGIAQFAVGLQDTEVDAIELTRLIVEGAVTLIPGADHAALLTLTGNRRLDSVVATDGQLPERLMGLQNSLGEGPCLEAIATGVQIRIVDFDTESRWPEFTPAALQAGAHGLLSTPVVLGRRGTATLTLIGTTTTFDDEASSLARIFAAHAGIALAGAYRQETLAAALSSRELIGQAKGILMERLKVTEGVAFAALVKVSADNNVKLRTVCEDLCRTGILATGAPKRPSRR